MLQKELILKSNSKITSAETDMYGNLRLGALSNLFIQSSINSAEKLGFGLNNLREHTLFWVLKRMTIEIFSTVKWNDMVIVETWPKDIDGVLYLRDFIIKDKDNNIVAKATSGWLAIDVNKKRPKLIKDIDFNVFQSLKDKHAIKEPPIKLNVINEGKIFSVKAFYSDIDINQHVTSTRYIDWMMDTISQDFHKKNHPRKLSINYLKETMIDEQLIITRNQKGNTFEFEGVNSSKNLSAFRGSIEF